MYPSVLITATLAVTAAAEPPKTLPIHTSWMEEGGRLQREIEEDITDVRRVSEVGEGEGGFTRRVSGVRQIETITASFGDGIMSLTLILLTSF